MKNELIIYAKSSSHPDEPYPIEVKIVGGSISMNCACPAGEWGQYCKHIDGILRGVEMFHFPSDSSLFIQFIEPAKKELFSEVKKFTTRINEIEKLQKSLKKELTELKKVFTNNLNSGIAFSSRSETK